MLLLLPFDFMQLLQRSQHKYYNIGCIVIMSKLINKWIGINIFEMKVEYDTNESDVLTYVSGVEIRLWSK